MPDYDDDVVINNDGETDCDVCGTPFDELDIEPDW